MTEKQSNLIVRTVTGVLFVAVMVAGMAFRPEALILLFALITGLTTWEYCGIVNQREDISVNRFITTAAAVYLNLAFAGFCGGITPSAVFIPYLLTIVYLLVAELYLKQPNPVNNWAYTMLGQLYIALPLSMIYVLAFIASPDGATRFESLVPLSVFVFLWVNDTGAYCAGSLLGRHKLFPRVSPGKTWEGSVGGGVFVLIAAAVIGHLANQGDTPHLLSIPQWMGLGLVVTVFGTWGDLVESLLKRTWGIKDSGKLLPGHGGMLDRFDSSLLAIPAAVIYLYTLSFFL